MGAEGKWFVLLHFLLIYAPNCSFTNLLTDVSPAVWLKMVISPARTCGAVTFLLKNDCQSGGDASVFVFCLFATGILTFIFFLRFHVRTDVTVGKWSRLEQQVGQSSRGSGRHEVNMTECKTSLCFTSVFPPYLTETYSGPYWTSARCGGQVLDALPSPWPVSHLHRLVWCERRPPAKL